MSDAHRRGAEHPGAQIHCRPLRRQIEGPRRCFWRWVRHELDRLERGGDSTPTCGATSKAQRWLRHKPGIKGALGRVPLSHHRGPIPQHRSTRAHARARLAAQGFAAGRPEHARSPSSAPWLGHAEPPMSPSPPTRSPEARTVEVSPQSRARSGPPADTHSASRRQRARPQRAPQDPPPHTPDAEPRVRRPPSLPSPQPPRSGRSARASTPCLIHGQTAAPSKTLSSTSPSNNDTDSLRPAQATSGTPTTTTRTTHDTTPVSRTQAHLPTASRPPYSHTAMGHRGRSCVDDGNAWAMGRSAWADGRLGNGCGALGQQAPCRQSDRSRTG